MLLDTDAYIGACGNIDYGFYQFLVSVEKLTLSLVYSYIFIHQSLQADSYKPKDAI